MSMGADGVGCAMAVSAARGPGEAVVRRVSIDGVMGIGGIVGGELTPQQLECVAPLLDELAGRHAESEAAHVQAQHAEDEPGKGVRKRNPPLARTAVFKRRSREPAHRNLRDFIAQQRQAQEPILDVELALQRMQMGRRPRPTTAGARPRRSKRSAAVAATGSANDMSALFADCCQLSAQLADGLPADVAPPPDAGRAARR